MTNESIGKPYNLRVNSLSTERYAKFIVSEQGDELIFDSLGRVEVDGELRHKTIVQRQNIEGRVLGGGDAYLSRSEFSLAGMSSDYGEVHQRILDEFLPLIVEKYQAKGIGITKTIADGSDSVNKMMTPKRVRDFICFL